MRYFSEVHPVHCSLHLWPRVTMKDCFLNCKKYVIQLVGPSRPYYDVSNVCRNVATLFLIDLTFTLASRQFLSLRFSSSSLHRFFVKV